MCSQPMLLNTHLHGDQYTMISLRTLPTEHIDIKIELISMYLHTIFEMPLTSNTVR